MGRTWVDGGKHGCAWVCVYFLHDQRLVQIRFLGDRGKETMNKLTQLEQRVWTMG